MLPRGYDDLKTLAAARLAHGEEATNLADNRNGLELARLPEPERKEWQALRAGVDTLLKRVQAPKP